MKRIVCVMLSILLLSSFGMTALAEETGTSNESGFSIGENPAYGEEDELFFPSELTPEPEATTVPTTVPESPAENSILEEGQLPQDESAAEPQPEEGESETIASSPAPEAKTVPSKQNYYPVIMIVAVLAACAILFVIVKKRKPAKRRDG